MMIKQGCSHGGRVWFLTFAAILFIFNGGLFAADKTGYEIFPLKHISVEQGKKYLSGIITGTVTHFPATSALLVTPEPNKLTDAKYELTKAKAILDIVDVPEQYAVKAILPASAVRNMPSNEQLALELTNKITRGVSIGSFSNPPDKNAHTKAIIDIHNDQVIAIVPVRLLDRLISAIGQSQNSGAIAARNMSKSQDKSESPAKRMVSTSVEPSEAAFLFTASDSVKTDPNSDEAVVEQEMPKQPVDSKDKNTKSSINEEQVVNLALADRQKLTVAELLGMVGPYLGLDFMYDEDVVKEEITINVHGKFRGPIKVKDLYPLLEEVLKFKGLAMTRSKGNLVMIAPKDNALDIDPVLMEIDGGKIEHGDGIIQRIFKLEHISTNVAKGFLESMKLTTNIAEIPETKTLILTGYAHRMARIQALLEIVDVPGEPKKFRFRQLQYTMAETLAPKIQNLAEQLGTISITIAATEAEPTTPPIPSRRPNETTAAYQRRVRAAQQAQRARAARERASATRATTVGQEPEQPTVYLDADERTNRILMIGLDEQLDDVEELISTLDVVQQDLRSLEIYKIYHVDAEDVMRQLEELGIISPSLTSSYSPYPSRITTGAKPTTAQQTTTAARQSTLSRSQRSEFGETPTEEPQVIVVEPTNSLLVNATAEQHVKIAEILSYVDTETDKTEIPYKVYPLENQSPDHLVTVLEPLIQEEILDKEGKVQDTRQKQEDLITIVPDPNTFSLIVSASKKNQEWISNLIEQLDKRRPQVLIDVTLVEISESDVFDYDLQAVTKLPRFEPGGQMDKLPALLAPEDTGFPSDRVTELGTFVGGTLGGQGFYADRHIQALLTLMQKKGYGRVLAKPKILVNDNELGHIDATNTIYVSRSSSSATTSGEAVVSSSFTFDEFPSGIELEITPHISKGNLLRLEIIMTRSSQGTPSSDKENVPPPPKIENNIETTVTVPDKSTIILGGIIQLDQQKQTWKVPLLGDIPLVGGLFRKIGNTSNDTRLYVFVKGEILRPDEKIAGLPDLEQISDRNKAAFEELEERFQSHQDWPGIKPKNMNPLNVLDAQ
jgi:type II secretory pathway component GspD/PulD (secretin)